MKNITYISASAGSAKTYELTERLKKAILGGECKPEEVILTTFTKAAASEFKAKAKAKLAISIVRFLKLCILNLL